ncbi:MAG: J domain-containing protein [bacterium]|nr:J domain-containing protein [bacterium]
MDFKDYYDILGVSKTATQSEIQKKYRKLAKEYHPDKNKDLAADGMFKEIGEAYDVLKDPEKRTKYDRYGQAWQAAQSGRHARSGPGDWPFSEASQNFDPNGSFFDTLEHMFGGHFAGQGGGPFGTGTRRERGRDLEVKLPLSLEEAARGGKHTVSLSDPQTGKQKSIAVQIPKGIGTGKRIRLSGQGQAGRGSGKAGDLYLVVELLKHPHFEVQGDHLYKTLDIEPYQAALGAKITMDTLTGKIRLNIPQGSTSGDKVRVKDHGLGDSGDLYVVLRVSMPGTISDRERELYAELARVAQDERPNHAV